MLYLLFGLVWFLLQFLPVVLMLLFFKSDTFSRKAHIEQLKREIEKDGRTVVHIAKRGLFPIFLPTMASCASMIAFTALFIKHNITIYTIGSAIMTLFLTFFVIRYTISIFFDAIALTSCGYLYVLSVKWKWKIKSFKIHKEIITPFAGPPGIYPIPMATAQTVYFSNSEGVNLLSAERAGRLNKIYAEKVIHES